MEWEIKRLGEIASIYDGTHQTPRYTQSGVPFYSVEQVTGNDFDSTKFISEAEFARLSKSSRIERGDVLMTRIGSIGDCKYVDWDVRAGYYVSLALLKFRNSTLASYFTHYSRSAAFKQEIELHSLAHAIPRKINLGPISHVRLPVPPAEEQMAIAECLSDAEALIDSLEQLLTKKRQIKQGAMQELLTGKRRLPGFSGKWQVTELRELGHCVRGVSYNPDSDLYDGDTDQSVRLLRSNNVQSNSIVRTGLQYVDRRRVRPDQYLQAGDLLLCMANGSRDLVGKSGRFVSVDEHRYTFGAFMGCFRPDTSAIDPDLVSFHLQTHAFRQHIDLLLAGSSINNLRPEGVLSFSIQIPTDQLEQQAISALLNDFDEEITVLEHRLTKAQAVKQAMAQALLTGRIRLVEPTA